MFKSTTRRVKGDITAIMAGIKFEIITHQAAPAADLVELEDEAPFWRALIPYIGGGMMGYSAIGQYPSQEEAVASSRASMVAGAWRATREEAERDAQAELDRRTNYRADGKPRFKS